MKEVQLVEAAWGFGVGSDIVLTLKGCRLQIRGVNYDTLCSWPGLLVQARKFDASPYTDEDGTDEIINIAGIQVHKEPGAKDLIS